MLKYVRKYFLRWNRRSLYMKNNRTIRFLLLAFCCVLLAGMLSGCQKKTAGKEETKKEAKGKYVEQWLELPVQEGEKGVSLIQTTEGKWKLYTYLSAEKQYRAYESEDGRTFTAAGADWLNTILGQQDHWMKDIVAGEDGGEYALYYMDTDTSTHVIKTSDGTTAQEVLPEVFQDQTYADTIRVLENGNIAVCSYTRGKAEIYGAADGSKAASLELGSGSTTDLRTFDYRAGKIAALNKGYDGFYIYDVEQATLLQEIKGDDMANLSGLLKLGDQNDCYYLDETGLYHMNNSGTAIETLIEGSTASMGDQSMSVVGFGIGANEEYLVAYNQADGHVALARYAYDADAPVVADQQLTIYGLSDNKTIRQAVSRFQADHPDVQVNFRTGSVGEGATSKADQIRVLNTELLSGNGADLLILDGMPVDSYMEKGVLENMTEFYTELSANTPLLQNVMESMKQDGKLYHLPARLEILSLYGSGEQVQAMENLNSLQTFLSSGGTDLLLPTSYEQYLRLLMTINYKTLFVKDGQQGIQEEEVRSLLETTKTLSDAMGVNSASTIEYFQNILNSNESEESIRETMGDEVVDNLSTGNDLDAREKNQAVFVEAGGSSDLLLPCAVVQELGVQPVGVNGLYLPKGMIGVNSGSKNKELAYEFLKLLFSEDIQSLDLGDGFPVNEAAMETWCSKEINPEEAISIAADDANGNVFGAVEPSGEQIRSFAEIGKAADTPVQIDDAIGEMIVNEGVAYYKEEKSLEDAVKEIVNKVGTYLAE